MFDLLLESSLWDDSNKWSNKGFGQEIKVLAQIEINFTQLVIELGKEVGILELEIQPPYL